MKDFDAQQQTRQSAEATIDREDRAFMLGGRKLYAAEHIPASVIVLLGGVGQDNAQNARLFVDALRMMVDPGSRDDFESAVMGEPIVTDVYHPDQIDPATGDPKQDAVPHPEIVQVTAPDVDTLLVVIEWMTERLSGRPFAQPSGSAPQSASPGSGQPLKGGRLQTVPPRSAPGSSAAS